MWAAYSGSSLEGRGRDKRGKKESNLKGENKSKCILKACCIQVYELGCELFDDQTFFFCECEEDRSSRRDRVELL